MFSLALADVGFAADLWFSFALSKGSCSANLPPNSHPDYDDDLDDQSLELEGDT
jgi:hypothetical protein